MTFGVGPSVDCPHSLPCHSSLSGLLAISAYSHRRIFVPALPSSEEMDSSWEPASILSPVVQIPSHLGASPPQPDSLLSFLFPHFLQRV